MFRTTGLICLALQEERFAEEGSKSLLIIYQQQQRHQQQQEQSFEAHDISTGIEYLKIFGNAHPPYRSEIPFSVTRPRARARAHTHTHTHIHTLTHTHTHMYTQQTVCRYVEVACNSMKWFT